MDFNVTDWKPVSTLLDDSTAKLIVARIIPDPGILTVPTAEEARQLDRVSSSIDV